MARRYRRRGHRRGGFKLPLIPLAILGGQIALANERGPNLVGKLNNFQMMYTGFDFESGHPVMDLQHMGAGYIPWVAYGLAKKVIFPLAGSPNKRIGRFLPISI